jgi:hypothetical protein
MLTQPVTTSSNQTLKKRKLNTECSDLATDMISFEFGTPPMTNYESVEFKKTKEVVKTDFPV